MQTEKFDNLSYLLKIKQQVRGSEIRMPNFRDPKASKVTSYLPLETSRRIMNVSSGGENMSIPWLGQEGSNQLPAMERVMSWELEYTGAGPQHVQPTSFRERLCSLPGKYRRGERALRWSGSSLSCMAALFPQFSCELLLSSPPWKMIPPTAVLLVSPALWP